MMMMLQLLMLSNGAVRWPPPPPLLPDVGRINDVCGIAADPLARFIQANPTVVMQLLRLGRHMAGAEGQFEQQNSARTLEVAVHDPPERARVDGVEFGLVGK